MRKLTRRVIEDCRHAINAASLNHMGVLREDRSGIIRWDDGDSVSFRTEVLPSGEFTHLDLTWLVNGEPWGCRFIMTVCRTDFRKWLFVCCGHLAQNVYFTRGRFACRHCGGLHHASQRRSHSLWRARRQLMSVGVMGLSEGALIVLAGLDDASLNRQRIAATIELRPITRPRTEGGAIMRA